MTAATGLFTYPVHWPAIWTDHPQRMTPLRVMGGKGGSWHRWRSTCICAEPHIQRALLQAAAKHEGELVIAAIGPLTNLALACKLDIGFPQRVKALYVMGGAERAGNVTPASEFNFHCDPEAAHLVLKKFPHAVSAPALLLP